MLNSQDARTGASCWAIHGSLQESIDITLPALAHDDAIGSIRAHELRAEPNSDLMLDKKLVCKVIRCIDNCEVVVEE